MYNLTIVMENECLNFKNIRVIKFYYWNYV